VAKVFAVTWFAAREAVAMVVAAFPGWPPRSGLRSKVTVFDEPLVDQM